LRSTFANSFWFPAGSGSAVIVNSQCTVRPGRADLGERREEHVKWIDFGDSKGWYKNEH